MIEVNKNTLASALPALGKLICRTSPLALCKSIKIEAEDRTVRLSTCGRTEGISFELETDSEEEFSCVVGFDEFRDAVKSGRNKTVELACEAGVLSVGDRYLITVKDVEWPDISPRVESPNCLLPEGVVEMFARAAQVVDRNEPRAILRGINLSAGGITATNGKELLNYDCPLDLKDSLTIPLPLALIQSKASHAGLLFYWPMGNETGFSIIVGPWSWTGKTLSGIYPNWKQVIPSRDSLTHEVRLAPEQITVALNFLETVPDKLPYNPIELKASSDKRLVLKADNGQEVTLEAELLGDWTDFRQTLNKNILFRLLTEKHTRIQLSNLHSPLMATGGIGRYIAMPMRNVPIKTQSQPQIQPQQEENKMEDKEKVVSASVQTVAPKQEPETAPNPLDDLGMAIEAFKAKMKASFDEVAALARKVEEAQIAQRQKERDFIQAKRAIERIRMASGF
ncbi:MAG: hypothetical protein IJS14_13860 [Lentisphaeria bacterium]|nr:hypothetical protein [Lentisphaeria bacterium]